MFNHKRERSLAFVAALLALAGPARAEPKYVVRMAAIAPEGTGWAREVRAFSHELEKETRGEVLVKWYMGGIAGNELQVMDRIKRGQLDGAASAGPLCQRMSPLFRVFAVMGLFQSREELDYVQKQLTPEVMADFRKSGFQMLGMGDLGPHVVLSNAPLRTLDDVRRLRLFHWDLEEVGLMMSREMGLQVVPLPLEEAGRAYDEKRLDAFVSIPTATLGFQWYTRAHYMLDLRMGFVAGCIAVTARAFDRLPPEHQRTMLAAAAKLGVRIAETGRTQDEQLLGGVFQRQGVSPATATEALRQQFLAAARAARERLGARLVAPDVMQRVLALLADYRAEHH
jgi:TRAP-type C4-dicarboxylate transport system substrate-binding protein